MMNETGHRDTGRLALAIGVVAAGSAVCLATYFAVAGAVRDDQRHRQRRERAC